MNSFQSLNLSESQLQIRLLNSLKRLDDNIFAFSIPNESKRSYDQARKLKAQGLTTGMPDLIVLKNGIPYFVEMKKKGKKPTKKQLEIHAKLRKIGCEVFVIDTVGKIENFLKYIGSL